VGDIFDIIVDSPLWAAALAVVSVLAVLALSSTSSLSPPSSSLGRKNI
jgi:CBS-domain-containing membrane protein